MQQATQRTWRATGVQLEQGLDGGVVSSMDAVPQSACFPKIDENIGATSGMRRRRVEFSGEHSHSELLWSVSSRGASLAYTESLGLPDSLIT